MNNTKVSKLGGITRGVCIIIALMIFCNIPLLVNAASGTIYESESNNTYSTADITYNDYDNYGCLDLPSDKDYWKITFPTSGNVNIYLGDIPETCNYNMNIYYSNGSTLLASCTKTGTSSELYSGYVNAGTTYYIQIYSAKGSSPASCYLFRAKVYPARTLDVPVYQQQKNDTCGCACGRMILKYYDVNVTEAAFESKAIALADEASARENTSYDKTYVFIVRDTINYYLSYAGLTDRYAYRHYSNESTFSNFVLNQMLNDYPVQLPIKITSTQYFPYTSGGHYVVIKGMVPNSSGTGYNAQVNDPHPTYYDEYTVPISAIFNYSVAHSGYVLYHS